MRRLGTLVCWLALAQPALADRPKTQTGQTGECMIKRGERVSLWTRVGQVIALVEAEALQDGKQTEVIRVRNLQNGRVHKAVVTEQGRVELMP